MGALKNWTSYWPDVLKSSAVSRRPSNRHLDQHLEPIWPGLIMHVSWKDMPSFTRQLSEISMAWTWTGIFIANSLFRKVVFFSNNTNQRKYFQSKWYSPWWVYFQKVLSTENDPGVRCSMREKVCTVYILAIHSFTKVSNSFNFH